MKRWFLVLVLFATVAHAQAWSRQHAAEKAILLNQIEAWRACVLVARDHTQLLNCPRPLGGERMTYTDPATKAATCTRVETVQLGPGGDLYVWALAGEPPMWVIFQPINDFTKGCMP